MEAGKTLISPVNIYLNVESGIKPFLVNLVSRKAPGPSPSFNVFDLIRFIRLLAVSGNVGRGRISRELNLGEGAIRTMLRRLIEAGLVTSSRSGCSLTPKGIRFWNEIEKVFGIIVKIGANELTLAPHSIAILIRKGADKVKNGIEQRDAAIASGAKSTVTIVFREDKMVIPGVSPDLERDYPLAFRELTRLMDLKEGDAIIISSADSQRKAEYGALAAAWSLI